MFDIAYPHLTPIPDVVFAATIRSLMFENETAKRARVRTLCVTGSGELVPKLAQEREDMYTPFRGQWWTRYPREVVNRNRRCIRFKAVSGRKSESESESESAMYDLLLLGSGGFFAVAGADAAPERGARGRHQLHIRRSDHAHPKAQG